jgi:NADPH:quinone reductase-like Zn-dependent oxidoreductase
MKAIVYSKSAAGDGLKLEEIEKPAPGDDEVLIRVHAAAVNPLDYHLLKHPFLRGTMSIVSKAKLTRPGRDLAGHVEAVGKSVTQLNVGDEVFGACNGAFAEYTCGPESAFVLKPPNVSFEQAATVPVAGLTALQGLRDKAQLQSGQKVLINGAAGGVGTFALQIAKLFGAEVTAICSSGNVEMVRSIGADAVIDYTQEDFTSNGEHYDIIFDLVSNHSFSEHRRALTPNGKYIGAGILGLRGSMLRIITGRTKELFMTPFVSQKFMSFMARPNQKDLTAIAAHMEAGRLRPVIDRCYSLSETAEAVAYVEGKHARGKVVIDCQVPRK